MNNDELLQAAKERLTEAARQTQEQSQEAAVQIGGLLKAGAKKLQEAADRASRAIADDLNKRS